MGLASLGGILSGAGDVSAPRISGAGGVGQAYKSLLNAFGKSQAGIFNTQQTYQPKYDALQASSLASLVPALSGILNQQMPGATNLIRGVNPGQTALLDTMTNQAQQGLDSGAALDPSLARVATQAIRGGQAARGLGYGPSDVLQESSALTQLGDSLRQERQNYASNVAGMNNQYQTQPSLSLLQGLMSGGAGLMGGGPSLTPTSLSSQLLTMPYQGKLQANMATASNNTGLYQSMDQNSNSFISGL